MKIGLASPISCYHFREYLYPESAIIAEKLSENYAPSVTNLAIDFLKRGHALVVFTEDPATSRRCILKGPSLTIYVVPTIHVGWRRVLNKLHINDFRLICAMRRYREPLDIMSVHWTRDFAVGARSYLGLCPVTVTVRDIIPLVSKMQRISWVTKLWTEITMHNDRFHFIANSDYTRDMIKCFWRKESTVIYNGVSDLFLDYHFEDKYEAYTFVSITVSITERKNISKLMEAFKEVHNQNPNTRLVLIGPMFIDTNPFVKEWKNTGLSKGVVFAGSKTRREIKSILTKSHCLVHPSLEETFGNILIEAMACKCLVIGGKDAGAVPYVLKMGERGILCDVTDVKSLACSMNRAIHDDYSELINNAFTAVIGEYSGEKICSDYISYFSQ